MADADSPLFDHVVRDADHEYATFDIGGWVGAVVSREGRVWVAVRRRDGAENVTPMPDLRGAIRHFSSAMQQAVSVAGSRPGS